MDGKFEPPLQGWLNEQAQEIFAIVQAQLVEKVPACEKSKSEGNASK
jgi:hypothetical protein